MKSHDYPAWRFHSDGMRVVVCSPEEDSMLDSSWTDKVHDNFDPAKAPTFSNVALVDGLAEKAVADVVEKRKGGRPKKVV